MFKMPSHPRVFIIVMEQGELGKGRDEKDFCFPLYFSTSSDGFPTSLEKLELRWSCVGAGAGQALQLGPEIPFRELEVIVHRDLLKWGPQKKRLTAEQPPDLQNRAKLSCASWGCVLWENWHFMHSFLLRFLSSFNM